MTRKELSQYWRYYLLLEKRFIETLDYTELHTDNYKSFSNNYALLIQAIGAELDTMFKLYCGYNTEDRKNIADYLRSIDDEEQNVKPQYAIDFPFREVKIGISGYDIELQPFKDWNSSKPAQSLSWWDAFDKLKHNRFKSRQLANQENSLNILAALYLIEMKMLKKITEGTPENDIFDNGSDFFTLKEWSSKVIPTGNVLSVLTEMFEKGDKYIPRKFDA